VGKIRDGARVMNITKTSLIRKSISREPHVPVIRNQVAEIHMQPLKEYNGDVWILLLTRGIRSFSARLLVKEMTHSLIFIY